MLFPSCCPVCGTLGPAPCLACRRTLRPVGRLPAPSSVDACAAAFAYRDTGAALIRQLKYHNQRAVVPWAGLVLAHLLAALDVPSDSLTDPPSDRLLDPRRAPRGPLVTWAPTGAPRRRRRGYDQARLLARALARSAGLPCRSQLRRSPGAAQTGQDRVERLAGPQFVSRGQWRGTVVVVDDVLTTGATLSAAATALRGGGATYVLGLVLAATPAGPQAQVRRLAGRNYGSPAAGAPRSRSVG